MIAAEVDLWCVLQCNSLLLRSCARKVGLLQTDNLSQRAPETDVVGAKADPEAAPVARFKPGAKMVTKYIQTASQKVSEVQTCSGCYSVWTHTMVATRRSETIDRAPQRSSESALGQAEERWQKE